MRKKIISIFLAIIMMFSLNAIAFAYSVAENELGGEKVELDALTALPVNLMDESIDVVEFSKNDLIATDLSFNDGITNFIPITEADVQSQGAAPRLSANITGNLVGNINHQLTSANPFNVLFFSMPVAQHIFLSFATTNPNYVMSLGALDTAGNIFLFGGANLFPGHAASWNAGTTTAQFPFFAFVIHSTGSVGASYTLNWNKSVPVATTNQFIFVSHNVADVVYLLPGNTHIGINGVTTIHLGAGTGVTGTGSTTLDWSGEFVRHPSANSHVRRSIRITDVQIDRVSATNLRPSSMLFFNYVGRGPGSGSSPLTIALPLGRNTMYHHWLSIFDLNANPSSVIIQTCYLGLQTPRRLFTDPIENLLAGTYFVIVDIATGTPIDLFGNLNKFYTLDGFTHPTTTPLANLWG